MNKTRLFACIATALALTTGATAQENKGGIDAALLQELAESYNPTQAERALQNVLLSNSVKVLALNQENLNELDTYFSNSVTSKGITDQESSGRCWLFTGLNVLRAKMIASEDLGAFEFSQVYNFFFDQLEKSNLFLQGVIDTRKKPFDDRTVEWLFKHPLSDGGTFTGVADLVAKYGVVPKGVMKESYTSDNTAAFSALLTTKLREFGLELRQAHENGTKEKKLIEMKEEQLKVVYRMLANVYGVPPTEFTWAPKDANGKYREEPQTYTPQSFYEKYLNINLQDDYVMLMNDPTRPYWKSYEIEYDRHLYD